MNDIRAGCEAAGSALTNKRDLAPFPCSTDGKLSSRITGAGVNGSFHTVSVCHLHDAFHGFIRFEHIIYKSKLFGKADTVIIHFHADEHIRSHGFGKHKGCQSHRSQARYQYRIISADTDFFNRFINRTEAAGNLCPIFIGQLVGQRD